MTLIVTFFVWIVFEGGIGEDDCSHIVAAGSQLVLGPGHPVQRRLHQLVDPAYTLNQVVHRLIAVPALQKVDAAFVDGL